MCLLGTYLRDRMPQLSKDSPLSDVVRVLNTHIVYTVSPEDDEVREVPLLPLAGGQDGGQAVCPGVE